LSVAIGIYFANLLKKIEVIIGYAIIPIVSMKYKIADMSKLEKKRVNTDTFKDLTIFAVIFIFVLILSYCFDVFVFIVKFVNKHPHAIIYIDEIIIALLTLSIGFAILFWRRWIDLKKEIAERIKLQEKLIEIANTKAETERIISRQLRSEIELRKQEEKILHLLAEKLKTNILAPDRV